MSKPRPLMDRLLEKVQPSRTRSYQGTPCQEFMGCRHKHGYGQIRGDKSENGRVLKAHRVSYELFVGPIPEDLVVDHKCNNKSCCNPAHLQAVTHAVNVHRGWQSTRRALSDFSEDF